MISNSPKRAFPFLRGIGFAAAIAMAGAAPVALANAGDGPGVTAENRRGDRMGPRHRGHHRRMARVSRALGLTDAQKASLRAILSSAREERAAIRATFPAASPERREALRSLRSNVRAEMAALLTPEQLEELEALKADRRARRNAVRDGDAPSGDRGKAIRARGEGRRAHGNGPGHGPRGR